MLSFFHQAYYTRETAKEKTWKKLCLSILASLALTLGLVSQVQADEYLRIGMEAAYAPFNWTQDDDSNGAVKIDGTNQYANGYDVQIAKKDC